MAENVIEPSNHPCLAALPDIFLKAMRGISAMVDAFLGMLLFHYVKLFLYLVYLFQECRIIKTLLQVNLLKRQVRAIVKQASSLNVTNDDNIEII